MMRAVVWIFVFFAMDPVWSLPRETVDHGVAVSNLLASTEFETLKKMMLEFKEQQPNSVKVLEEVVAKLKKFQSEHKETIPDETALLSFVNPYMYYPNPHTPPPPIPSTPDADLSAYCQNMDNLQHLVYSWCGTLENCPASFSSGCCKLLETLAACPGTQPQLWQNCPYIQHEAVSLYQEAMCATPVEELSCPNPRDLALRNQVANCPMFAYHHSAATCQIHCETGFIPKSKSQPSVFVCRQGLTYFPGLECERKQCTVPALTGKNVQYVANSCTAGGKISEGQRCALACPAGMSLPSEGSSHTSMCSDGVLQPPTWDCVPATCVLPNDPKYLFKRSSRCAPGRVIQSGSSCEVSCNFASHNLAAPPTASTVQAYTCQNGVLTNPDLACVPKPCRLGSTLSTRGFEFLPSDGDCVFGNIVGHGKVCPVGCAEGFLPASPAITTGELTCVHGGTQSLLGCNVNNQYTVVESLDSCSTHFTSRMITARLNLDETNEQTYLCDSWNTFKTCSNVDLQTDSAFGLIRSRATFFNRICGSCSTRYRQFITSCSVDRCITTSANCCNMAIELKNCVGDQRGGEVADWLFSGLKNVHCTGSQGLPFFRFTQFADVCATNTDNNRNENDNGGSATTTTTTTTTTDDDAELPDRIHKIKVEQQLERDDKHQEQQQAQDQDQKQQQRQIEGDSTDRKPSPIGMVLSKAEEMVAQPPSDVLPQSTSAARATIKSAVEAGKGLNTAKTMSQLVRALNDAASSQSAPTTSSVIKEILGKVQQMSDAAPTVNVWDIASGNSGSPTSGLSGVPEMFSGIPLAYRVLLGTLLFLLIVGIAGGVFYKTVGEVKFQD